MKLIACTKCNWPKEEKYFTYRDEEKGTRSSWCNTCKNTANTDGQHYADHVLGSIKYMDGEL